MSDFGIKEEENKDTSLMPVEKPAVNDEVDNEYLRDFQMQAREYGQKLNDAALKAKDYASEKLNQAGEKFKELQNKDFSQMTDDAKEFAKKNPGQTILISAAVGLVVGLLLRGGRR